MLRYLEFLLASVIKYSPAFLFIPLTSSAVLNNQTAVFTALFGLRQVRRGHCIIVSLLRKSAECVLRPLVQNVSFYAHSVHYPNMIRTAVNPRVIIGVLIILHNEVLVE